VGNLGLERRAAAGALEVERHGALVRVVEPVPQALPARSVEQRLGPAERIPGRRHDADDVHAEIGEQLRRVRGGPVGEIEDPNAGERTPQRGEMISHRP